MKDFVVYHNPDVMGGEASTVSPVSVVTNKNVGNVIGDRVWLLTGEGSPRQFYIRSYFIISTIEPGTDQGFNTRLSGETGKVFDPMIEIGTKDWFADFRQQQGNFAFGFQPINDPNFVEALENALRSSSEYVMSYFETWMRQKGLSESSITKYAGAMTGAMTLWARQNSIVSYSLADITNSREFETVANRIRALDIFKQRDRTGHQMYSSALSQYASYLAESPSDPIENDIDSIIESKTLSVTEKAALIKIRIGQGSFRGKLINYWKACSATGFTDVDLLIASHIKPWAECDNVERIDVYNGFLLLPNLDRAFELGYISFSDTGAILISPSLGNPSMLGIDPSTRIAVKPQHKKYLTYHRRIHSFE